VADATHVVLVTGAARGIGRACAKALAGPGIKVYVNDVADSPQLSETLDLVRGRGAEAEALIFNVAEPAAATAGIEKIGRDSSRLDVLVNNAGITSDSLLLRMKEADWDRVLDVNLKGAFTCMRAASKLMLKQQSGRIINISSIVGFMGNPGQVNYSASKAGLIGLTKSAARELASRQITVNAVAPGFIATDMTVGLPEKVQAQMLAQIPLGRFGTAEEVAAVVAFLASDASAYITGQVIHVNGGMLMM